MSPDAESALQVCKDLLSSLKQGGPEGRKQFEASLHPDGRMAHARPSIDNVFFHNFNGELQEYVKEAWVVDEYGQKIQDMEEGIDGQPTVLLDNDLATVWTPYWFRVGGKLTHVGTNSFGLLKVYYDKDGKESKAAYELWKWKIVVLHDTGREPTDVEVSRRDLFRYRREAHKHNQRRRLDNEYRAQVAP
jgi:hypothetical protein